MSQKNKMSQKEINYATLAAAYFLKFGKFNKTEIYMRLQENEGFEENRKNAGCRTHYYWKKESVQKLINHLLEQEKTDAPGVHKRANKSGGRVEKGLFNFLQENQEQDLKSFLVKRVEHSIMRNRTESYPSYLRYWPDIEIEFHQQPHLLVPNNRLFIDVKFNDKPFFDRDDHGKFIYERKTALIDKETLETYQNISKEKNAPFFIVYFVTHEQRLIVIDANNAMTKNHSDKKLHLYLTREKPKIDQTRSSKNPFIEDTEFFTKILNIPSE